MTQQGMVRGAPSLALQWARYYARWLRRLNRLPRRELVTTVRAGGILLVVELMIRSTSLPRLAKRLGVRLDLQPAASDLPQIDISTMPERAQREVRSARRVADRWPLAKGPCLRRSLVVARLLRRYGPAIRIGLAGDGPAMTGHAWVEIGGRPLESTALFRPFEVRKAASR